MTAIDYYQAWIDGACKGNPGEAAIGGLLKKPSGEVIFQFSQSIGIATNNVAEYQALEYLLNYMEEFSKTSTSMTGLLVHSDSELLVRQMAGSYKVRKKHLILLHESVKKLISQLPFPVRIIHVDRWQNQEADDQGHQRQQNTQSGDPLPMSGQNAHVLP